MHLKTPRMIKLEIKILIHKNKCQEFKLKPNKNPKAL